MITFYGNKVGRDYVIIRKDDVPDGTRPEDVIGDGFHTIEAPDSERARSMLSVRRRVLL
jgi:hypothetical protein